MSVKYLISELRMQAYVSFKQASSVYDKGPRPIYDKGARRHAAAEVHAGPRKRYDSETAEKSRRGIYGRSKEGSPEAQALVAEYLARLGHFSTGVHEEDTAVQGGSDDGDEESEGDEEDEEMAVQAFYSYLTDPRVCSLFVEAKAPVALVREEAVALLRAGGGVRKAVAWLREIDLRGGRFDTLADVARRLQTKLEAGDFLVTDAMREELLDYLGGTETGLFALAPSELCLSILDLDALIKMWAGSGKNNPQ